MKNAIRCAYLKDCYLAEALECYGFKTDCPLYLRSNDEPCNEARFHAAVDQLINKTRIKHERLYGKKSGSEAESQPEPERASGS